jgi:hypothetical protein
MAKEMEKRKIFLYRLEESQDPTAAEVEMEVIQVQAEKAHAETLNLSSRRHAPH